MVCLANSILVVTHQFVRYRHERQFVMYRPVIDLKRKVILFGAFNFASAVQGHLRMT